MKSNSEFLCRVPVSLMKDASISPEAKLLYVALCAHADEHTGRTFVRPATVERIMGCGRGVRERAQRELARKACSRGRWGIRVYRILFCRSTTIARFHRSGQNEQLYPSPQSGQSVIVIHGEGPTERQPSPQPL